MTDKLIAQHIKNDINPYAVDVLGKSGEGTVFGHEIAGVIKEFGAGVDAENLGLKLGDRVLVYPWTGCQKCDFCIHGG